MVGCGFATTPLIIFRTFDLDLIVKLDVPGVAAVVTLELIQNMSFFLVAFVNGRWALAHQLDLLLLSLREW